MSGTMMIYGSYGYTGKLITNLALRRGMRPILAGRTEYKTEEHAKETDLGYRVFALDDPAEVKEGLEGIDAVIHCAGPFSRTAKPMAEGCIASGTHYLDITGEIDVFEALSAKDARAKDAGVMLLPGAGFDVVPTDCLSAHLKNRLPSATHLTLGFQGVGRPSRGTATTMIESLHKGGMIRRDGVMTEVPSAWKIEELDFGEGPTSAMTIPWGDVSTAFYSTGIPNIEVFMAAPPGLQKMAKFNRHFGWLFAMGPVQAFLKSRVQAGPAGPSDSEREKGHSLVWGRVSDEDGNSAESRLRTPEGYTLTAATALEIGRRATAGEVPPGFQTPAKAFGPGFILEFEGVTLEDL